MSFRTRLALFLAVTLVAVQAMTAAVAYFYLRHDLAERGKRELAAEMGVFTRQLGFLSDRVTDAVKVSSLDYALRSAIAQHSRDTELSALRNHGQRIGASRMILIGLDGSLEVDTASPRKTTGSFRFPELLGSAAVNGNASAIAAIQGHIYWIVAVPVRAPVPIGFIAAFIPVDNALLARLRALSAEPHSIVLASAAASGKWLPGAQNGWAGGVQLPRLWSREPGIVSAELVQGGHDYLTSAAWLETAKGSEPVAAVIRYPLDEALAAYRSFVLPLAALFIVALFAAVIGTMMVVRGLARPLEQLATAARRIAGGDYATVPTLPQRDEIGHLGQALNHMAHAIADREMALKHAFDTAENARADAVRANLAKSQFLANMSHELRTPLNAILGFSELVEQQVIGPLHARYVGYAHDIHTSACKLLSLVERILDIADTENGQLNLARAAVQPTALLQAAIADLGTLAQEKDVQLVVQCSGSAATEMDGDSARLKQAFANILHNAIKFTPAGGGVCVSCRVEGDLFSVRIADSGIGIAPDQLPIVVRPFHRLRSAFDGQNQGAGLGLPFAKVVIELHGGHFGLTSEVGAGTTVTIELPARMSAVRQAA